MKILTLTCAKLPADFRIFQPVIVYHRPNFSFNYSKYQHKELEIDGGIEDVGTVFDNQTVSYRATFEQKPFQKLTGRSGSEGYNRDTVGATNPYFGRSRTNTFAFLRT